MTYAVKLYRTQEGDKLHLDGNCPGIRRGHTAADTNAYRRFEVEDVDVDFDACNEVDRLCADCRKRRPNWREELRP